MHHCQQIKKQQGAVPALHPTLAVLFIMLKSGTDLSKIERNCLNHRLHKYYDPAANFPQDISNLLPPSKHCWLLRFDKRLPDLGGVCPVVT